MDGAGGGSPGMALDQEHEHIRELNTDAVLDPLPQTYGLRNSCVSTRSR